MKSKKCFIVGAGPINDPCIMPQKGDCIYAADGGLRFLESHGIVPDVIMGDFDSLGEVPEGENVITFPEKKDYTDMWLCAERAMDDGYNEIIILGGLGGRHDHTLANIQLLHKIAKRGGEGILCDGNEQITVIIDSAIKFDAIPSGTVSVFSLSDVSTGVFEHGLEYPLENATLTNDFPIGVSNAFCGTPSEISVKNGALCIMWNSVNN